MFTWLHSTGAVSYETQAQKDNYLKLNEMLDQVEAIIWEVAPPRSVLPKLRELRLDDIPINLENMFEPVDSHGRKADGDDWTNEELNTA